MPTTEEYLQNRIEQPGIYRGYPIAWTLEESTSDDSQAVAIAFQFAIHQQWSPDAKAWSEEWPVGYFTANRTWIIGKDGSFNAKAGEALKACGLWNGDLDEIAGAPPNVFVHLDVDGETYQGKTRYRANWINPDADEPRARGGFTPVSNDLLKSLKSRFGSQIRAAMGGAKTGAPPAPPTPAMGGQAPAAAPAQQPAQQPEQQPAQQSAPPPRAPQPPPAPGAPGGGQAAGVPRAAPQPTPAVQQPAAPAAAAPAVGDADDPVQDEETPF